jgi:hypothetical protein
LTTSDNPYRATFQVMPKVAKGADTVPKMREYHLSLEIKLPEVQEKVSAVAGATAAGGLSGEPQAENTAVAVQRPWHWTGAESMYPYWGVTRCTNAEMRKWQAQEAIATLRLNLGITPVSYANVIVAGEGANMTFQVMVPVLTNTVALDEGEQLCLEVFPKPATVKSKVANWRTEATLPTRGRSAAVAAEKGKRGSGKALEQAGCTNVAGIVEL